MFFVPKGFALKKELGIIRDFANPGKALARFWLHAQGCLSSFAAALSRPS
jgi:hypothetical protein